MPLSRRTEFNPLLPIGFHQMNLGSLRALCVGGFPDSTTRGPIMDGLTQFFEQIEVTGLRSEVWVDGSFLTHKPDPADSDLVVFVEHEVFASATPDQRSVVEWIKVGRKADLLCDSYIWIKLPDGAENAALNEYMHSYWHRQFGFDRNDNMKGLAVIRTGVEHE